MSDPRDIVDIAALRRRQLASRVQVGPQGKPWLAVWFRCCHTYGRIYRNQAGTLYEGPCPRCGSTVRAVIGPGGTSRRFFEAR
jgi:hypothetical protein